AGAGVGVDVGPTDWDVEIAVACVRAASKIPIRQQVYGWSGRRQIIQSNIEEIDIRIIIAKQESQGRGAVHDIRWANLEYFAGIGRITDGKRLAMKIHNRARRRREINILRG